jgi:uncharacterized protein YgfB (UPF0149 family)
MSRFSSFCIVAVLCAALGLTAAPAGAWGSATHAYLAAHTGRTSLLFERNEIYGATLPDVFNYSFDLPPETLALALSLTHDDPGRMWAAARTPLAKAGAFGYMSHSDAWGADFTAHHDGAWLDGDGYVVEKARVLGPMLKPQLAGLGLSDQDLVDVAHVIIEASTDVMLKRLDPAIGARLTASALLRGDEVRRLLLRSYAEDLAPAVGGEEAARLLLTRTEAAFRNTMVSYGQALMQDEATATHLLAEQLASFARGYLAAKGVSLPEGLDLTPLVQQAMQGAMVVCADFPYELAATVAAVRAELAAHEIRY